MTIRPATATDIPAILQVERDSAGAAHWNEQEYAHLFNGTERTILVAEQESILGFVIARAISPEWEIENMAVAASQRRRHVGTQLVAAICELARERGGEWIHLEVRKSNAAARELYEKCGFIQMGERPEYYSDPAEDAVLYSLQLSESSRKTC